MASDSPASSFCVLGLQVWTTTSRSSMWYSKPSQRKSEVLQHSVSSAHAEIREQLAGASSLLPPCGFGESNPACQAWWQEPLPLSHLSRTYFLNFKYILTNLKIYHPRSCHVCITDRQTDLMDLLVQDQFHMCSPSIQNHDSPPEPSILAQR